MPEVGRFLLVEDEELVARALARRIRQRGLGECVVAATLKDALALLREATRYTAIIIDIGLPDGSGLDVLATVRQEGAHALTPAIVRSGACEPGLVVRATALDAKYLVKNAEQEWNTLLAFLEDAISPKRKIARVVRSLALTEAVADVVIRSALGEPREAIAEARGTTIKTVENQQATAAEQTGKPSFHILIQDLLRDVARAR
jgi:DNA-binding NarL/FixJ family response regulator